MVCVHDDELVALHAFIKKTRATPEADLKLAHKRKQDYERTT
jgi:phage-related protein